MAQYKRQHAFDTPERPITQISATPESCKRIRTSDDMEQQKLCPQQRYVKRPKHPGMATFDASLRKLPVQRCKEKYHSRDVDNSSSPTSSIDFLAEPSFIPSSGSSLGQLGDTFAGALKELVQAAEQQQPPTPDENTLEIAAALEDLRLALSKESSHPSGSILPVQGLFMPEQAANLAIDESLLLYPRAQHLHMEARLIYTGLVATDVVHAAIMTATPESALSRKLSVWRALQGLRQALMQNTHDFFRISQDRNAPDNLRRLAVRYSVSISSMRLYITEVVLLVQPSLPKIHDQLLHFIERARIFLDTFEKTLPSSSQDWSSINDSLHLYLHVLIDAGLASRCVYNCHAYHNSKRWAVWQSFKTSPGDTLDNELRERYWEQHPWPLPVPVDKIEEQYRATHLVLSEHILCCLSGWLCFGSRIAKTFHEFCKVFKFLAWFGATS